MNDCSRMVSGRPGTTALGAKRPELAVNGLAALERLTGKADVAGVPHGWTRVVILNQGLWQSTRQFEPRSLPPSAATSRRFCRSCRPKSSSAAVSCSTTSAQGQCQGSSEPQPSVAPSLSPVRASMDCLIKVTVCTRPFRTDGPRHNSSGL